MTERVHKEEECVKEREIFEEKNATRWAIEEYFEI